MHTRSENGGIVAASNDALALAHGRVRRPARPRRRAPPRRPRRASPRRSTANPTPTTSTPTRTRSTAAGHHSTPFFKPDWSPERMRTPDVHLPPLACCGRSLVEEVGGFDPELRGLPGLRPGAAGHRAGPRGRPRAARCSTTGACSRARPPRGSEAKPYAFDGGAAGRAGRTATGSGASRGRARARTAAGHLPRRAGARPGPLVSIVIPTRGRHRAVWGEPGASSSSSSARS